MGALTSVDLRDATPRRYGKEHIAKFSVELCGFIDMKPLATRSWCGSGTILGSGYPCPVDRDLRVSGHFAEDFNRAFIDIFSCKEYGPKKAAEFCAKYFGAKDMKFTTIFRT
jgi:hypothetical protein